MILLIAYVLSVLVSLFLFRKVGQYLVFDGTDIKTSHLVYFIIVSLIPITNLIVSIIVFFTERPLVTDNKQPRTYN